MFKSLFVAIALAFSVQANAKNINVVIADLQTQLFAETMAGGFDWKVGDTASYSLNMGFIKGSMVMTIQELTAEVLTISQVLDLGFAGKQDCVMKLDPTNGQAKSLVCNGQDQKVPGNDVEVIEMTEDNVTVAAGTFQCIHIKARQKSDNKEFNQWANPKLVPVMGMIKAVTPGPFGTVTLELTSFKKN